MPRLRDDRPKWELDLVEDVKTMLPFGWSVREKRGKVEVIRHFRDTGKRQSAVLPLEWAKGSKLSILNALTGINAAMASGLSLKEGVKLAMRIADGPSKKVTVNWREVFRRFQAHKLESGKVKDSTFAKEYAPRLLWLVENLERPDGPTDGEGAVAAMRWGADGKGEPGSRGRKIRIQHAAQMLKFAVSKCGAAKRWNPPEGEVLADLIGVAAPNAAKENNAGQARPLTDEEINAIYNSIKNEQWRLAVGLLACFGLRGVELNHCRANAAHEGPPCTKLWVSYGKRTARGSTQPRWVEPCSPIEMRIAEELLQQLETNPEALPPLGTEDRFASSAISTYLNRNTTWNEIRAKAKKSGEKVSVYSFRHAYALRAAKRGVPPRMVAASMGHSYETHCRIYSKFLDLFGITESFRKAEEAAFANEKSVL